MNRLFSANITVFIILWAAGVSVHAEGFYISSEIGMNFASSMDVTGSSNDRASVCDGYINPGYATVTNTVGYQDYNCTGPNRGSTGSWQNGFGSAEGILPSTALGYQFRDSRFHVELEYFYRGTGYDETSDVHRAAGESGDKLEQELVTTTDRIGDLTSHNLFANLYIDFANSSRFTPYIGLGVGYGFTDVEYSSLWARNPDASRITTGGDLDGNGPGQALPNAAEIQANLAGTASVGDARLDDTQFGYQILFGVDYELTESVVVGVKGRWSDLGSFDSGGTEWNPLRSHPAYLRTAAQVGAGGDREPVEGRIKLDAIEMFAISVNLKYKF